MASRYLIVQEKNAVLYQLDNDFGIATAKEMFSAIEQQLRRDCTYNELIAFHPVANLSHISKDDFTSIMRTMKENFERKGVSREKTAIVAGHNQPLRPMTTLWVGYCELDNEIETTYRSFGDLESACNWIELPKSVATEFLRLH